MKIKTVKDIVDAANKIIERLVTDSQKNLAIFNLLVDHEDGTLSNCAWTPTAKLANGKNLLVVEDYTKIMILLLTHPRIKELQYDEPQNTISAIFHAPEMQEVDAIENPM